MERARRVTTGDEDRAAEGRGTGGGRGSGRWIEWLRRVAYHPGINRPLVALASLLAPVLPRRWLLRLPLVGRFEVELASGDRVTFMSRGGDSILRRLHWAGPGGFEEPVQKVVTDLAPDCCRIFDVGANTGLYTLLAARVNPEARIWAFEPLPRAFAALEANVAANGLAGVTAEAMVVTDRCGPADLHVPRSDRFIPTTASLRSGFRNGCEIRRVPGTTLDAYAEARGIRGVDLIKIDVEAMEPAVLRGAEGLLRRDRPWILCEVLPGLTEEDLSAILEPLGYRYLWISEEGPVEVKEIRGRRGGSEANYLFVPEGRPDPSRIGQRS